MPLRKRPADGRLRLASCFFSDRMVSGTSFGMIESGWEVAFIFGTG